MSEQKLGIYCVEGVPDQAGGEISARPMLEMLSHAHEFRFIHRIAVTREEFFHHFMKWARGEYSDYPILYLWYHGFPEGISLNAEDHNHRTSIRFKDITDVYNDTDYCWERRIIHFGACCTLTSDRDNREFLKHTRLVAISGYKKQVGWVDGIAMELLYLSYLYEIFAKDRRKIPLSEERMRACKNELKKKKSKGLVDELGFDIVVRSKK